MNKPIHAKPSLYAFYFEIIKAIGKEYGYNIVLHGSMNRDLDLIAIPWHKFIGDKYAMLNDICNTIGGSIMNEDKENFEKFKKEHHGRECYVININRDIVQKHNGFKTSFVEQNDAQYYIDISIIPMVIKN